jgi:DNA-binding NtrC family response regulator
MTANLQAETGGLAALPSPMPIRALLLDDSTFDRARIRRLSQHSDLVIEMDEVDSIAAMNAAVQCASYDLILIDYRLPVGDGMAALDLLLQDPTNRNAGKIMITGNAGIETAVQAMRGGCHDFLVKDDMNADLLRTAMLNALSLARHNRMMQQQADHQRNIIREGLVAALGDRAVLDTLASVVRAQLPLMEPGPPKLVAMMDPGEVDALLAGMLDEDEFIFH